MCHGSPMTDMAKTKGGGSQGHDRTRPMTSVRRRDRGVVEERVCVDVHIDNDNQQQLHDDGKWTREKDFLEDLLICLCW